MYGSFYHHVDHIPSFADAASYFMDKGLVFGHASAYDYDRIGYHDEISYDNKREFSSVEEFIANIGVVSNCNVIEITFDDIDTGTILFIRKKFSDYDLWFHYGTCTSKHEEMINGYLSLLKNQGIRVW